MPERRANRMLRHNPNLTPAYVARVSSEEWREFVRALAVERGSKCEGCQRKIYPRGISGHHVTYERLGHELPEDVKILCWDCHKAMHALRKTV